MNPEDPKVSELAPSQAGADFKSKLRFSAAETQLQSSKMIENASQRFLRQRVSLFSSKEMQSTVPISKSEIRRTEFEKFRNFSIISIFQVFLLGFFSLSICAAAIASFHFDFNVLICMAMCGGVRYLLETLLSGYWVARKMSRGKKVGRAVMVTLAHVVTFASFVSIVLFLNGAIGINFLVWILAMNLTFHSLEFLFTIFAKTRYAAWSFLGLIFSVLILYVAVQFKNGAKNLYDFWMAWLYTGISTTLYLFTFSSAVLLIGLALFIQLRASGLNRGRKCLILYITAGACMGFFTFGRFCVESLSKFGNLSIFMTGRFVIWVEKEELAIFYAVAALITIFATAVVWAWASWGEEIKNLLFKLVFDFEDFLTMISDFSGGLFGLIDQKAKREFILGKIRELRQTLKGENKCLDTCALCEEKPVDILFDPCKHSLFCQDCFDEVRKLDKKCPGCSKDITVGVVMEFDQKRATFSAQKIIEVKVT